jgi:hypothetical protein
MRSEVLTTLTTNIIIFWDVTQCILVKFHRRFGQSIAFMDCHSRYRVLLMTYITLIYLHDNRSNDIIFFISYL